MGVDWRSKNLKDEEVSFAEAMQILGSIRESLRHPAAETMDAAADRRWQSLIGESPEAVEFANACNALGRKMRAAGDCRPELRIRNEERKAEVLDAQPMTVEEDACAYADSMRAFHRK